MQDIGQGVLKNLWVAVPPVDEQERMVAIVKEDAKSQSTAIDYIERQIALLQEYRTRLVADVVTGKLDVREAARRISDETEAGDFEIENGEFANGYDALDSRCLTERKKLDEIDANILEYGTGANQ
jgi:type I restriction enzyme S subunit